MILQDIVTDNRKDVMKSIIDTYKSKSHRTLGNKTPYQRIWFNNKRWKTKIKTFWIHYFFLYIFNLGVQPWSVPSQVQCVCILGTKFWSRRRIFTGEHTQCITTHTPLTRIFLMILLSSKSDTQHTTKVLSDLLDTSLLEDMPVWSMGLTSSGHPRPG